MNLVQEDPEKMQAIADALPHPKRDEIDLGRVLHALSDPVRLQIVSSIANGGECAMNAIHVPVAKSTCTHHFKVLREAGVLAQRQVGTARMNTLRRDDLDARFPGLLDTILKSAD
jgi:DNA-binding transcriptional ArsR family regulator